LQMCYILLYVAGKKIQQPFYDKQIIVTKGIGFSWIFR